MTSLAALLSQLRHDLTEEATPLPGQSLAYGRPHAHPRVRYFPRYTLTGLQIPGSVRLRPDCPRPIRGRCECPPDGSWRPAVGVIRADATAQYQRRIGEDEPVVQPIGLAVWVDELYVQGPDGLWRCRWPVRRALERLRGASVRRWSVAVRLLRGEALATVWGPHGMPPDPAGQATAILRDLERWAQIERETDWERRPRQWWDKPKDRSNHRSESQAIAEHETSVQRHPDRLTRAATDVDSAATTSVVGREPPDNRLGRGSQVARRPASPASAPPSGIPVPSESLCA